MSSGLTESQELQDRIAELEEFVERWRKASEWAIKQAHEADDLILKARQKTDDENVRVLLDKARVRVFEIHTGTGNA